MKTMVCLTVLTMFVLAFAVTAWADDVTDAMTKASATYGAGDYKETSQNLQTALAAVNQMLIAQLIDALPEPPSGWTAEEPEGIDAAALGAAYFAALVVERTYHTPDDALVEMTIAANSPMLVSLKMFLTNPSMAAMAGQSGMKKVTACGYDAIEQSEDGRNEINILAGDATLISISGSDGAGIDAVRMLADATDCRTVVEVVE